MSRDAAKRWVRTGLRWTWLGLRFLALLPLVVLVWSFVALMLVMLWLSCRRVS